MYYLKVIHCDYNQQVTNNRYYSPTMTNLEVQGHSIFMRRLHNNCYYNNISNSPRAALQAARVNETPMRIARGEGNSKDKINPLT